MALEGVELASPVGASLDSGTYESRFGGDVVWYYFPLARKVQVLIEFLREGVMGKVADFLEGEGFTLWQVVRSVAEWAYVGEAGSGAERR